MLITRESRSGASPASASRRRSAAWFMVILFSSELESGGTGGVGQCRNPTVIEVAAAIEDHLGDPLCARAFGQQRADLLGFGDVAVRGGTHRGFDARRRGE